MEILCGWRVTSAKQIANTAATIERQPQLRVTRTIRCNFTIATTTTTTITTTITITITIALQLF